VYVRQRVLGDVGVHEGPFAVDEWPNHAIRSQRRDPGQAIDARASQQPAQDGLGLIVQCVTGRDALRSAPSRAGLEDFVSSAPRLGL
jgi:hypothetical protein